MTVVGGPEAVMLRSGDMVRVRQIRPDDKAALARAYARLGEVSRYRRFFSAPLELPDRLLRAATEVDHENHEALVALPPLSPEIVGECRFVRLADRPDTAVLGVTVADAWQRRGLGSALLARISARALEVGIRYFSAEVLAENRAMLAMLPMLGGVETERSGAIVDAQIEIAGPGLDDQVGLLNHLREFEMVLAVGNAPATESLDWAGRRSPVRLGAIGLRLRVPAAGWSVA